MKNVSNHHLNRFHEISRFHERVAQVLGKFYSFAKLNSGNSGNKHYTGSNTQKKTGWSRQMFGPQAHHLFHHENKMFCDDFDAQFDAQSFCWGGIKNP